MCVYEIDHTFPTAAEQQIMMCSAISVSSISDDSRMNFWRKKCSDKTDLSLPYSPVVRSRGLKIMPIGVNTVNYVITELDEEAPWSFKMFELFSHMP